MCFFMLKAHAASTNCIPGTTCQASLFWQGKQRTFSYHLPKSYTPHLQYLPLVIALHGTGEMGIDLEKGILQGRFDTLSDQSRIMIAYPDALQGTWNSEKKVSQPDDRGFIRAVILYFRQKYNVDPERIYVLGMSTGGLMTYQLACDSADMVTAIATVAAAMPLSLASTCKPARPIPVLMINGTSDPILPWNSHQFFSVLGGSRSSRLSIPETLEAWRKIDKITSPIFQQPMSNTQYDSTWVWLSVANMPQVVDVVLYTIYNGGHTWPGGQQYLPVEYIGKTSKAFDASIVIWQFFISHRRTPLHNLENRNGR